MILIYLLFVPGILTLIDFIYFIAKGEKLFDHFGGFLLDGIQLVGFPILFVMFSSYLSSRSMEVFSADWIWISIPITLLSVIGYFAIRYAYPFISETFSIIILVLLACGIFINVSMIYDVYDVESFFSIPIILLYIIQISNNVKRLLKP